jgi:hypothetical protein
MSKYTTTREGFQEAMKWSLAGTPDDAKAYCDATTTANFYHLFNNHKLEGQAYVQSIAEWRGKISEYIPIMSVHQRKFHSLQSNDCVQSRVSA